MKGRIDDGANVGVLFNGMYIYIYICICGNIDFNYDLGFMCIIACDHINVGVLLFFHLMGHAVRSRKLMIIQRKEDEEKDRYRYDLKGEKKEEHSTDDDHQTYPDLLDIAGMDYSPAKRKPPIHN